jgi:pyruvate kinase
MSTDNFVSNITLGNVQKDIPSSVLRKTKIICTLGPACWSVEGLIGLIDSGMNIARLNFSHGDHEGHSACLDRLREALANRPGAHVGVMLDTKGPEIRTGFFKKELNGKLKLTKNAIIEIGTDYDRLGDEKYLACSYQSLATTVKVGSKMLVADGSLMLEVTEVLTNSVNARILNNCVIGERKNMNLPGAVVDLPTLTEKDIDDLQNFGVPEGVDFIAASFVRRGSDIDYIREVLGPEGAYIKIIAKIENQEGMENFDEILEKTDAIMVARGDLGMEIPIEKVFLAQKMMIRKCNIAGKPVVTATQMLESMITNPRPTRAECADVANAVLDGTDCVMLSGETANGEFGSAAVMMMARTSLEAESIVNYDLLGEAIRRQTLVKGQVLRASESVASSAVKTAYDVNAKMIVVLTSSGTTARFVAKYRPSMPVLVLTAFPYVCRQTQGLLKNCESQLLGSMIGTDSILLKAEDIGRRKGWIKSGDSVVCVYGMQENMEGTANMLRVVRIE